MLLLDYEAPIDPVDKTRTTPLHLAARVRWPFVNLVVIGKIVGRSPFPSLLTPALRAARWSWAS